MDTSWSKLQVTVEDRGAWHAAVHGVTKSWTELSIWTTTCWKKNQCLDDISSWIKSILSSKPIHMDKFMTSLRPTPGWVKRMTLENRFQGRASERGYLKYQGRGMVLAKRQVSPFTFPRADSGVWLSDGTRVPGAAGPSKTGKEPPPVPTPPAPTKLRTWNSTTSHTIALRNVQQAKKCGF